MPSSSKWSVSLRFFIKTLYALLFSPHAPPISFPFFNNLDVIWWRIGLQIMKLLAVQFFQVITVCYSKRNLFQNCITVACAKLNKWFTANKLTLNLIKFTTNNTTWINLNIGYGLQIDDLHWTRHSEYVIPKLSSTCPATQYLWQQTR